MFRTITPILSIVIAGTISIFFVKPIIDDIFINQEEASQYREAVAKAAEFNQELQRLVEQKNSFGAREIERLETVVPDRVNGIKLIVDLKEIAREKGMLLNNAKLDTDNSENTDQPPEDNDTISYRDDFTGVDVSFTLVGTYEQLREVLTDLERSLVVTDVVKLSTAVTDGKFQEYNVRVRAYALKPMSQ